MQAAPPPWPPSFKVEHGPGHLVVHWRWRKRRASYWFAGIMSVLSLMLGGVVFKIAPLLPPDSPEMRPAGLLVIAVMLYAAIAALINHTELSVRQGVLEVSHRPLPWWPRRNIDCRKIRQLFCREHLEHDQDGKLREEYYSVHAELEGGRQLRLVGGLWTPAQASWIEDTVEVLLGLEDFAVAGERFKVRGLAKYR